MKGSSDEQKDDTKNNFVLLLIVKESTFSSEVESNSYVQTPGLELEKGVC